jgi:hypothetical protein
VFDNTVEVGDVAMGVEGGDFGVDVILIELLFDMVIVEGAVTAWGGAVIVAMGVLVPIGAVEGD